MKKKMSKNHKPLLVTWFLFCNNPNLMEKIFFLWPTKTCYHCSTQYVIGISVHPKFFMQNFKSSDYFNSQASA